MLLQNFECSKWENHVLVEFLLSFSNVVLWLKCKYSWEFPIFRRLFSRNKFLVWGFTFQWMVAFELGDAPWGDFEKNHRMGESPDSPPTPLPLFPLLNLQTVCKESDFSVNFNNIKIFYTQTLSHLLKITKFLVKILSLNS